MTGSTGLAAAAGRASATGAGGADVMAEAGEQAAHDLGRVDVVLHQEDAAGFAAALAKASDGLLAAVAAGLRASVRRAADAGRC